MQIVVNMNFLVFGPLKISVDPLSFRVKGPKDPFELFFLFPSLFESCTSSPRTYLISTLLLNAIWECIFYEINIIMDCFLLFPYLIYSSRFVVVKSWNNRNAINYDFMPNTAKIPLFYKICKLLSLFGMKLKKSPKTGKNEKTQLSNECFKSIKYFKSNC